MKRTLCALLCATWLSSCAAGAVAPPTAGPPPTATVDGGLSSPTAAAAVPTTTVPVGVSPDELPVDDLADLAAVQAPPRDLVALAEAFGRCRAPCPRVAALQPPQVETGNQSVFALIDFATNQHYTVTAELRYAGPIVLMYVEVGAEVDQQALVAAAQRFERELYPRLTSVFGREVQPGVDGDPRVTVLNARDRSGAVLGYFSADDSLPRAVAPYSNQREMFVQNIAQLDPADDQYLAVLVHEFQHLIHQSQNPAAATWFNEGFSQLAEDLAGFADEGLIGTYLSRPDTGLTAWGNAAGQSLAHYGASHLFLRYLRSHYLTEADLRPLIRADAGHEPQVLVELARRVNPQLQTFGDLVVDWAAASLLDDPTIGDGRYSYRGDDIVPRPLPRRAEARAVSADWQDSVAQFGVDYLQLPVGRRLRFSGDAEVGLTPLEPADGAAWYARRGDERSVTLTRSFDLRGVRSATLDVTAWYELETDYDFAYVTVSIDGGRSWQPLSNAETLPADAESRHFDGALNGVSGLPQATTGADQRARWQQLRFDLSPYAGQQIELRFWVVTDEAINAPGLLIDRIAIPEIGFDDGALRANDWQAAGFARVSGRLAQQWRLLLVQQTAQGPRVRPLPVDAQGNAEVELDGTSDTTLIVVAATPYTTERANYRVQVTP